MPSPSVTIERKHNFKTGVALTATETTTEVIPLLDCSGGGIIFTAVSTAVSVTFLVRHADTSVFTPLYDKDNAAVSRTIAVDRAYSFPDELFGFPYFKMLCNAGTATVTICRKT